MVPNVELFKDQGLKLDSSGIVVDETMSTNIDGILAQNSQVGQILNALLGYNSQPSLTEVLAYLGYIIAIASGILLSRLRPTTRDRQKDRHIRVKA